MPYLQRKFVDLIHQASSKWVNWDPPIPVEVGAYGQVEGRTGELRVDGNVYDAEFQVELNRLGLALQMADHPPQEGGVEDDFIVASKGARRIDMTVQPEADVADLGTASIKGQWQFAHGKRDALLTMYCPRLRFLPRNVILDSLYKIPKLKDKWIVTSVHVCPAFSMYLSNKSGEKVSLALVKAPAASAIAGGDSGFKWWSAMPTDPSVFRKACDKTGDYRYTPLYTMKRRIGWMERMFREDGTEAHGDDLWCDVMPPWDPLDQDGDEFSLDMQENDQDGDF